MSDVDRECSLLPDASLDDLLCAFVDGAIEPARFRDMLSAQWVRLDGLSFDERRAAARRGEAYCAAWEARVREIEALGGEADCHSEESES